MKGLVATFVSWGPLGVLILAVLDSAGIPLPLGVDALVVTLGTWGAETAFLAAVLAVAGSVAGNLILYSLARKGGEAYAHRHILSPRAQRLHDWFIRYGLVTVFIPALLPIPLPMKLFVILAGAFGVRRHSFILTVLAARIPRYFGLAYLGVAIGTQSLTWFVNHALELTLGAVGLFLFLYFLIRFKDRGRPGEALG